MKRPATKVGEEDPTLVAGLVRARCGETSLRRTEEEVSAVQGRPW